MRVCDLNSGAIRIKRATKKLKEHWLRTKESWKDKNSEDFEQQYLLELQGVVTRTIAFSEEMSSLIDEVQRDCEDPDHHD